MNSTVPHPQEKLGSDQRLRDLEALIKVISQINRSLDLADVLKTSLTGVQETLGADFGCFVLLNPLQNLLELGYSNGLAASLRQHLEQASHAFHHQTELAPPEDHFSVVSMIGAQIRTALENARIENSLLIPLVTRTQVHGILVFGIQPGRLLAPKSLDLLSSIGEQTAMALENARLYAALKQSEAQYRGFVENSLEAFWEVDAAGKILYINDAGCRMIGMERHLILQKRANDFFVYDKSIQQLAVKSLLEQGVWTNQRVRLRAADGQIKFVSLATITQLDPDGKISRYQTIFHDVTEQIHLLDTLQQRNQELAALNSIAGILANPLELDRALDQVCQEIISITGMESAVVYLKDEAGQCLYLRAHRGVNAALLSQVQVLGLDDPAMRRVAVEGQAIALNELSDFDSPQSFLGPREEGYHAGVCAPIERRGAPVGVILAGSKSKNHYDQSDVDLMLNVGRQIGTAFENADLYARMQRRVLELDGLAQLGIACNATLEPLALSQVAVDWGHKLLGTDYVIIRLLENNRMRLAASFAPPGVELRESMEVDASSSPIIDELISLTIPDVAASDLAPLHRQSFLSAGIRSIAVTALSARDRVIGAMAMAYQTPHAWQAQEIDLLRTIAHQVSSSIDSAQLFQNVLSEQRKVQAIFDSGLSGLFATDAQGRIVMFNHAAEQMTGWTFDQVRHRTWDELFRDPALDASAKSLIDEALWQKRPIFARVGRRVRTRDGRTIPVAKAVAPLLDEKGNVAGAVGAFWDLSNVQEAELVREEFLRLVAHQLRSPLTALLSALQLLEKPGLSKARRAEMSSIIKSDAERLSRFASQFLKLEAIAQAERPLDLQPVPLAAIINTLVEKFKTEGDHRFAVNVSKPEPLVYADHDRLEQVLRNLLDNAVMYTPKDTQITVSASASEEGRVWIQVHDAGPGIPLAEQAKIFQPFYRSPRDLGRHTHGHGLGLAIAQRMVKEMDGELAVKSEKGHGATFYFTLRRYP